QGEDGKPKSHLATFSLAVELRDAREQGKFEAARPVVMDRIIQNLGKKKFEDLNQVQGRYLFRSQVIDAANEFLGAPIVTEIYFSEFLLQ
ncbi:MAG: flagellar basal body-associated FliL family protein, partial [Bdellovibrionales bacterium]|nr:flagellar basal body-associated FliL family protein [Oligoflexia bacterium]